jgi:Plasmid pRiA4b ORF-3-like protein
VLRAADPGEGSRGSIMAKKKSAKAGGPVYQMKVTLEGSKPPIWRRLLVPTNLNLGDLHYIIQIAMGWTDSHLHQFFVGDKTYGVPHPDMDWVLDEDRVQLARIVPGEKFKFRYEYDFGDSWSHLILIEKLLPAEPGKSYPICVKGKGCCPPEDCGGVWGFAEFVEVMADPEHPEHEELKEWYGGDFDPEAFDIDEVNRMLTAPA